MFGYCMVPGNIHTPTMEGTENFRGGVGVKGLGNSIGEGGVW